MIAAAARATSAAVVLFATGCAFSDATPLAIDPSSTSCEKVFPQGPVLLDQTCVPGRCGAKVTQSGCALVIETSSCSAGAIRAQLGRDGVEHIDATRGFGACSPVASRGEAALSATCTAGAIDCRFDLYPEPGPRVLGTTTRVQLVDAPFTDPRAIDDLSSTAARSGWLSGMVLLGERLLVLGRPGFDASTCDPAPTPLWILDADRLSVLASVSLPPCASGIATDPAGRGFLAAHGTAPAHLARFDEDGQQTADLALGSDASGEGLIAVAVLAEGARALVLLSSAQASRVVAVDLDRFAVAGTSPPAARLVAAAMFGGELWASDPTGRLERFDPLTAAHLGGVAPGADRASSIAFGALAAHPSAAKLLVSATGRWPAAWIVDRAAGATASAATPYSDDAAPWALAPWPVDPSLAIAGVTSRRPGAIASILLLDPDGAHFLPGAAAIGQGVVAAFAIDEPRRRIFALLPWEAAVVRIDP